MKDSVSRPAAHSRDRALGTGPSVKSYQVTGRLWIEKSGETYLSWGRVVLLERIREHGSISSAARSMGMGYRHAWDLVEEMNRLAPRPLVERAAGGSHGGGTRLTHAGEKAIEGFWKLVADFRRFLARQRPQV